jgi:hypothetical protein
MNTITGTAAHAAHRIQVSSGVLGISHAARKATASTNPKMCRNTRKDTRWVGTRDTSGTSAVGVPHL